MLSCQSAEDCDQNACGHQSGSFVYVSFPAFATDRLPLYAPLRAEDEPPACVAPVAPPPAFLHRIMTSQESGEQNDPHCEDDQHDVTEQSGEQNDQHPEDDQHDITAPSPFGYRLRALNRDTVYRLSLQPSNGSEKIRCDVLIKAGSLFIQNRPRRGATNMSEAGSTIYTQDEYTLGVLQKYGGQLPPEVGSVASNGFVKLNKTPDPGMFQGRIGQLPGKDTAIDFANGTVVGLIEEGAAEGYDPGKVKWYNEGRTICFRLQDLRLPSSEAARSRVHEYRNLSTGTTGFRFPGLRELLLGFEDSNRRARCLVDEGFTLTSGTETSGDRRASGHSVIVHPLRARGTEVDWSQVKSWELMQDISLDRSEWPSFHECDSIPTKIYWNGLNPCRTYTAEQRAQTQAKLSLLKKFSAEDERLKSMRAEEEALQISRKVALEAGLPWEGRQRSREISNHLSGIKMEIYEMRTALEDGTEADICFSEGTGACVGTRCTCVGDETMQQR